MENLGQVRGVVNRCGLRRPKQFGAVFLCGAALLGGCARGEENSPLDWWHGLEGGRIAAQRPPPPGENDPYPNLAMVPPMPVVPDAPSRQAVSATLIAERDDAAALAASVPMKTAKPAPKQAPANQPLAAAQLDAADSPPAPASAAPASPAVSAPAQTPAKAPPAQASAQLHPAQAPPAGPLPSVPDAPPPPPVLPGIATGTAEPAPAAPKPQQDLRIGFEPGTASLPAGGRPALQALAARRGSRVVQIIGYGEASDAGPAAQQAALLLGLHRAQAVATALTGFGVPASALRLGAEARGGGAMLRLLK